MTILFNSTYLLNLVNFDLKWLLSLSRLQIHGYNIQIVQEHIHSYIIHITKFDEHRSRDKYVFSSFA